MSVDTILYNISAFVAGLFLLERGADLFIDNTAALAKRLGIPEVLIALLTAGAEWEELAVVVASVAQHRPALAFSNVVGSCISNILGAFSLGLLFQSGVTLFDRSAKLYTTILFGVTSLLAVLLATLVLERFVGGLLVAAFAVYIALIAWSIYRGILAKPEDSDSDSDASSDAASDASSTAGDSGVVQDSNPDETTALINQARKQQRPITSYLTRLIIGFIALSISGYLLSHSSKTLAATFGISESSFGATFLSLATTLPEKFVAVMSGSRGHSGILVANTVGSNIFLLTLCLGVHLLGIASFDGRRYLHEIAWMWASSAVLLVVVLLGSRRWIGGAMLIAYIVFLVLELVVYRT